MPEKKKDSREKEDEDENDDYFEKVWKNWASRRRCEKRHLPKYIRKKDEE